MPRLRAAGVAFGLGIVFSLVFSSSCGDDPVGPGERPFEGESVTLTIEPSGGSVLLSDGSGVVFPPGAVSAPVSVTVQESDPREWFDGDDEVSRVVLSTTAEVSVFQEEVQVRVALPDNATPEDIGNVVAGVVDEETGAVTVEPSTIETIDGKPFLVVRTDHFTNRLFEWFVGRQPPSSAMLSVPYYNQGSSPFCWAASLHMVTQGAEFQEHRLLTEIIGKAGIDEGGISAAEFRMSGAVSDLVKSRTGVRPDRKMWDYVNAGLVRDHLWREVGLNGRPVAVFSSRWEHAVVVVGYDVNTFRIHDPASTGTSSIGYRTKAWEEFTRGMERNDKLVTLVVPHELQGGSLVTVNFLPQALQFAKPSYGAEDPSAIFRYGWDHSRSEGYAFRHASSEAVASPLPGEVDRLQTRGEIQIANASLSDSREVSVYLDVTAVGAPVGAGRLSTHRTVTVGPNSAVNLNVPEIPVDTFRYNTDGAVTYALTVSALVNGSTVDRQSLSFVIDSVTPEIRSVTPSAAAVGDVVSIRGSRLGVMKYHNEVTFNDAKVDSVVSWSDSEVRVMVPEHATSGPLVVTRGEVESEPVEFTVADFTTLSGTVESAKDLGYTTLSVTGPWSLTAVGATLEGFAPETQHRIFSVKPGEPAELTFNLEASANPGTWGSDSTSTYIFKGVQWRLEEEVTSQQGLSPTLAGGGSDGNRSYTFTPEGSGDTFRVYVRIWGYRDEIDAEGNLTEDVKFVERTMAIFVVESQ